MFKALQELLQKVFKIGGRPGVPSGEAKEVMEKILNLQKKFDNLDPNDGAGAANLTDEFRQIEIDVDNLEFGSPFDSFTDTQRRRGVGQFAPSAIKLNDELEDLAKKTGASTEEVRRVLRETANEAYLPNDPKIMRVDDDESLLAYIQSQKQMGNETDLMLDIIENADLPSEELEAIKELAEESPFRPSEKSIADEVDDALRANAIRGEDLAKLEEKMADIKNFGKSVDELMQEIMDEKVVELRPKKAEGGDVNYYIGGKPVGEEEYNMQGDYMDLTPEGMELFKAYRLENPDVDERVILDALKKQGYSGDMQGFAFGGRVGFATGGGTEDDRDEIAFEYFGKPYKELNFDELDELRDLMERLRDKTREFNMGGRVGLQGGGGPKIGRRGFLGLLGAGIGSLMMPRSVKKAAELLPAAKPIMSSPGMPDWFPLLANQIRNRGKIVREPDYGDFTSGGDTTVRYQLNDNSLAGNEIFMEEDLQTGAVSIFGRGDDFQQVSLDYTPGERTIAKGGKIRESEPSFEAGEFFKGEIQDVENFVDSVDDLRGEVVSWRKLSGIDMTPKEKIKGSIQRFKDEFKNPNPEPEEFAQGGGVGSLFKERAM